MRHRRIQLKQSLIRSRVSGRDVKEIDNVMQAGVMAVGLLFFLLLLFFWGVTAVFSGHKLTAFVSLVFPSFSSL